MPSNAPQSYTSTAEERTPLQHGIEDQNGDLFQSATEKGRLFPCLVLALLCYLITLGHRILDRVDTRNGRESYDKILSDANLRTTEVLALQVDKQHEDTDPAKLLIVYGPEDDPWQQTMAQAVLEGCQSVVPTADCQAHSIATATFEDVQAADAIILGSSVQNANSHPAVLQWIDEEWDILTMSRDKVGAAFVTAGGISAGQESTLKSLVGSLMVFGTIVVGGETWESPFGVAAITGEPPFTSYAKDGTKEYDLFAQNCFLSKGELISPLFLEQAKGLGRRVARVTHKLKQ